VTNSLGDDLWLPRAQGQNTDGIFPNTAMAKQLGKVMGTDESKK
jgi:hypothetical protein